MSGWVLAGLAATLVGLGEAVGRWWIRRRSGYYVWPPRLRINVRLAPGISSRLEPEARFMVNAVGERGADLDGPREGVFRILVAGGSAAECFALDQAKSWPAAVERLLGAPDALRALGAGRAHVGNIGRSGVAARQLDVIFEHVLPQYGRLSAIVIMVGAADVVHWLEDGAPLSLETAPPAVAETFACHPQQRFGLMPAQWALAEVARRVRRAWLRPWTTQPNAGGWYAAARAMRAQAKEVRTSVPDPTGMLARFDRHFRQLVQRARAHADRVLVVRQPWFEKDYTAEEAGCIWHGGVGRAWKERITAYYSLDVLNHLMALVDARSAAMAAELGVQQLDLRPVLTPGLEHYYDYVHYTPAGALVVARAVAAALLERPAQPARRQPVFPSFSASSVTCISSMPPTR
ncbi:MAG: hypothetical protein ACREN5_17395 [Gemmatimonadales bacterium]